MSNEQWAQLRGLKGPADKPKVIDIMRAWSGTAAEKWTWFLQWAYQNGAEPGDADLARLTGATGF